MYTDEIGSVVPSTGKQSTRWEAVIETAFAVQPGAFLVYCTVKALIATWTSLPDPATASH
jgi:hypothetical protein